MRNASAAAHDAAAQILCPGSHDAIAGGGHQRDIAWVDEFYDAAIAFAKEIHALLVIDAAYAPLNFQGKPLSVFSRPGAKDVAVELHSMSKGFN